MQSTLNDMEFTEVFSTVKLNEAGDGLIYISRFKKNFMCKKTFGESIHKGFICTIFRTITDNVYTYHIVDRVYNTAPRPTDRLERIMWTLYKDVEIPLTEEEINEHFIFIPKGFDNG